MEAENAIEEDMTEIARVETGETTPSAAKDWLRPKFTSPYIAEQ